MASARDIAGYRILAPIGRGAASELYAVQDSRTKQVWALKHVTKKSDKDHRFIEQVQQEYEVGSKVRHPNIRAVERILRKRKMFRLTDVYLIMELVDATSLDRRPPRSQAHAVKVFAQVARALAHMHDAGFVHADLKPTNIMVTDKDEVKIIDLGQACAIGTIKKRIQGTPGYMAPEQAHRESITPQTDVYNFGATMYWVLVGEVIPTSLPPKDDSNSLFSGALDAELVDPPVPPMVKKPGIHPLLSKLIMECVQLKPANRPASMKAVANKLDLILELLENSSVAPPPLVGDEDTTF